MRRFELEDKIQAVWATKEDLELVIRDLIKLDEVKDEIIDTLVGIMSLHNLRSKELWELFEKMVDKGDIS